MSNFYAVWSKLYAEQKEQYKPVAYIVGEIDFIFEDNN